MIIEENIELINWAKVPLNQITSEIIEKFGTSVEGLKLRLWLEGILSQLKAKIDEEKYPGSIFLFLKDKCYFELVITEDAKFKMLYCSYNNIWFTLIESFLEDNEKIRSFLENIMDSYFMKNPLTTALFEKKFDHSVGYNIGFISFGGEDYFGRRNFKENYRSGLDIEEHFSKKQTIFRKITGFFGKLFKKN